MSVKESESQGPLALLPETSPSGSSNSTKQQRSNLQPRDVVAAANNDNGNITKVNMSTSGTIPNTNGASQANNNTNSNSNGDRPIQRNRSSSKSSGNYNPSPERLAELATDPNINPDLIRRKENLTRSSSIKANSNRKYDDNSATNGPSSLFKSSPQPQSQPKSQAKQEAKNSSSKSESDSALQPPKTLQEFVHVVKLVSPDQSQEFLKILSIPLYPATLVIGRQNVPRQSNKITDGFFDSRVLSRTHAELFIKDDKLYIKDLKSSNGTFINDQKIEAMRDYELHEGDKIDLGTTLESQLAHKKITCRVDEYRYIDLSEYQRLVRNGMNKGDLEIKKLELFNSSIDALIFSDVIEDRENLILKDLVQELSGEPDIKPSKSAPFKSSTSSKSSSSGEKINHNINVKDSIKLEDIIKNLVLSVNNEYVNQQKLKEINRFLKHYNSRKLSQRVTTTNATTKIVSNDKMVPNQLNDSIDSDLIEKLKSEVSDLHEKIQEDQARYEKIDSRNNRLQIELSHARDSTTAANAQNAQSYNEIKQLNAKLEATFVEMAQKDETIEDLQMKLSGFDEKLNQTKGDLETNKVSQESKIGELNALISSLKMSLKNSVAEKEQMIETEKDKFQSLEKDYLQQAQQIEELKAQLAEKSFALEAHESKAAPIKEAVDQKIDVNMQDYLQIKETLDEAKDSDFDFDGGKATPRDNITEEKKQSATNTKSNSVEDESNRKSTNATNIIITAVKPTNPAAAASSTIAAIASSRVTIAVMSSLVLLVALLYKFIIPLLSENPDLN